MVNSQRNEVCHDNPDGCWLCGDCRKHHNCKEGADYCCTSKTSKECDCRHCKIFTSQEKSEGEKHD